MSAHRSLQVLAARLSALLVLVSAVACHGLPPRSSPAPAEKEVVDVGYGQQRRSDVTGAVTSVSADQLPRAGVGRVEEMLRYRIPGLMVTRLPNGDYSLRIRGSHGEPLVVIDGVPAPQGLPSPLLELDPARIRSVSVLKDAGSTAAFGSRGGNGVILISTRR